jgi:hypothetical protein
MLGRYFANRLAVPSFAAVPYYTTWVLDPDGHDVEVVNKIGQID